MQVINLEPINISHWEIGLTGHKVNKINYQKMAAIIDIVSILLVVSSCFIWLFFV